MADDMQKIKMRESKWQKKWRETRAFVPKNDDSKPKYYNLIEFPFPSGAGLHVGHMLPYTGMDVMARFKRMRGFDVLYPIGYDSMGISSEKYATKIPWYLLIANDFTFTEELLEKYSQYFDSSAWTNILRYQNVSEDFIEKHKNKFDWTYIKTMKECGINFSHFSKEFIERLVA